MPLSQAVRADLILLLVTLLAGLGWIFSREALAVWPPMLFIGTRFLLAGGVVLVGGRNRLRPMDLRGWGCAVLSGVMMAAALACWILGLKHTEHLGVGAFLVSLGVLLVPVVGLLMFGHQSSRSVWVALGVALVGVALLASEHGFVFETAHFWFFASALVFAVLFNLNARYAANLPVIQLVAIQLVLVGLVNLLLSAVYEDWPARIGLPMWGWFLASVLIATSLRFFLQIYAQGQTTAARAALVMLLEPVWTALLAMLWYDETLSFNQLAGCALIFIALLVNRWSLVADVGRRLFRSRVPG